MKYSELLHFEPITEVVKFDRLNDVSYQESLVRTFVFSKEYEDTIIPFICSNLDYTTTADTFGLQIVGNYGTGKSHLMSLFTLIAENPDYLTLVSNDKARENLAKIAGKYNVLRFELGNSQELWSIVCYQIDKYLRSVGIDYSITDACPLEPYAVQLSRMMAHYEAKFPDKGFLLVIDEMLSYLKGRSASDKLNRDLAVLQALGQVSDHSKFRIVFGVQEVIYNSPEFQFAGDMLNKVNDRYKQITITKQEVKFVTEQRLLRKTDEQKAWIRNHLSQFTQFFNDLHANIDEYVELFPVHPAFFDNFQLVQVKNGQREILKTLSSKFESLKGEDVPSTCPGLISYDRYWIDLTAPKMQTDPDVHRINEIMAIVSQKIDDNFVGVQAKKNALAHRIANACAVKILQSSLSATNGVTAETLVDDLCWLDSTCFDREILQDVIDNTANKIVSATVGQYFEKNEFNQEYHLRIVGGINYEQKIKDYAAQMTPEVKDQFFFNFLVEFLPIEIDQYRLGFPIWAHRIDWISHKTMIDGYIFMGNPNERSTTHPQQHFYIYFMPIFTESAKTRGNEEDSVYFVFDNISQEMKDYIALYAAAESLKASVDSSQKRFYESFINQYKNKLKQLFNTEFKENMEVYYRDEKQTLSPELLNGPSKEMVVSKITSFLLEDHFNTARPNYPKFTALRQPLTFGPQGNFDTHIKQAKQKIANPNQSISNGEAILHGLGLLHEGRLSIDHSIYAKTIKDLLEQKGPNQVINRDEILECFWEATHSYRSKDYQIEADFEYLVLAAMVALGYIEIDVSGKIINAANIGEIVNCAKEDYYCFNCVRRPRGVDHAAMRELSLGISGVDLSAQIPDIESGALSRLLSDARQVAEKCARALHDISGGIQFQGIELISQSAAITLRTHLDRMKGIADRMASFNTVPKLKNFPFNADQIREAFSHLVDLDVIKNAQAIVNEFSPIISYLEQARQYIYDDAFVAEIDAAIREFEGLSPDETSKIAASRQRMTALKERYADWYIQEYKKNHITNIQESERQRLLNSPKLAALKLATQSNYVAIEPKLAPWLVDMRMLRPAETITKELMMATPYKDFNPREFKDKTLPNLDDLKTQLDEIFDFADAQYHLILTDDNLLKNMDALTDAQVAFLEDFKGKHITEQNFPTVMQIIQKLTRGITPVSIKRDELFSLFNRPLTPEELIQKFNQLVNGKLAGIDRSNARISLD